MHSCTNPPSKTKARQTATDQTPSFKVQISTQPYPHQAKHPKSQSTKSPIPTNSLSTSTLKL